jgi:predicted DNA-binding transcriptional regulator AlpA
MPLSDFKLLTKADAAAVFGVCTKTIDNYIREGLLPPPVPFASRDTGIRGLSSISRCHIPSQPTGNYG